MNEINNVGSIIKRFENEITKIENVQNSKKNQTHALNYNNNNLIECRYSLVIFRANNCFELFEIILILNKVMTSDKKFYFGLIRFLFYFYES